MDRLILKSILLACCFVAAPATADTVALWLFDDPPGSTVAIDSSGNDHHGTITGVLTSDEGGVNSKFWELGAKYFNSIGFAMGINAVTMNLPHPQVRIAKAPWEVQAHLRASHRIF